LKRPSWSPYIVGTLIGVLSWVTFGVMGEALGVSTTFVRVAGLIEGVFSPEHVKGNAYYAKYMIAEPAVDWQMMLVIGVFIGAAISSRLGQTRSVEVVPELWAWRFGPSRILRYLAAFVGGALVLIGSRLAGGCTSGHGISGGLQYALGSWVFVVAFFASGVLASFAMFGRKGRSHV
jgi:uncharacterized membrane protein YedE/YeeE